MDELKWFSERLSALRGSKGVSARDMSLSLGQSESYINKIENRRTLPSMTGFFYICEYLNITPSEFFAPMSSAQRRSQELAAAFERLTPLQQEHIYLLLQDLLQQG